MSETETNDSILRRVDKLLAIARHERSNPAEAAAAAAMAAKIMKKYQISEGEVLLAKLSSGQDLETANVIPTLANWNDVLKRVPLWANRLAVAVARLTDTQVVIGRTQTKKGVEMCLVFRGYTSDVKLASYIMSYLQTNIRRLRADFMKTYTYKEKGLTSLRSYTDGLSIGIIDAINAKIADNRTDSEISSEAGNALVVAKEAAISKFFGDVKYKQGASMTVTDGFSQGVADGRSISIDPAIENEGADAPLSISLSS